MKSVTGFGRVCVVAGAIMLAAGLAACSKQKHKQAGLGSSAAPGTPAEFSTVVGDRVHFTVDSSELTAQARATLRGQAKWLARYPGYTVTIEGHADERGTREYNIALGARRAEAVRTYLRQLGVNSVSLQTVSYGKERPVATCNDISCWSQNRRAVTKLGGRAGS